AGVGGGGALAPRGGGASGPRRKKRLQREQAVRGYVRPHRSLVLLKVLVQIDSVQGTIARFPAQMQTACAQDGEEEAVVALLDGIAGLCEVTAQVVVAE